MKKPWSVPCYLKMISILNFGKRGLSILFLAGLAMLMPGVAQATSPTVTTNPATSVTATGATLNGTVNPNNRNVTSVTFDYGLTTGYGSTVNATPYTITSGSGNTSVSAALTGLTCNTTYHFRVKAINSSGTSRGGDQTFPTSACAPVVTSINTASTNPTAPATAVAWTVVFSASVNGVNAADFVPVQGGSVTGASITSVTGSGTTWTVNANTGSGTGTLGLNLVDDDTIIDGSGTPLGGVGLVNGNFTGQAYTIPQPFCSPPSNIPVGVPVSCQCDTFALGVNGRAALNPSTIFGGNWVATTIGATNFVPQIVNSGYMRLTDSKGNEATAATVPGIFPAAGNYISVEFLQYAYNGSGADGIAVTLSDYAVTPQPGAFGGSLGYAQKGYTPISDCQIAGGCPGFAGGWIGVALDEFGGFQYLSEGRTGGTGAKVPQSVGVRGSGSGMTGYPWLKGTVDLTTTTPNVGIANSGSTTPSLGDYYQVVVDSRGNNGVSGPAYVSVNRDITGVGNTYSTLISSFDAYAAATAVGYTQAPVPQNWQISFTGSTGGSYNTHEIGGLRICAQNMFPPSGGTPGGFNAIDEANTRSDVNAISGHLYTKLAGTPFTVKVAALNPTNSGILSTYAFSSNKMVTVNLIDDSVGSSCNVSAATCSACSKPVVTTQSVQFVKTDTGFKQSGNFTVPAYAKLLVQMTDGTTTGCSVDNFAVRPLGIASVNATFATPPIKAGSNFSLTASTTGITTAIFGNPSGYTGGVLKINANAVQVVGPATVAGVLAGSFSPATSGTSSATATGSTFTYSEVGAFRLLGPDFTLSTPRIPGVYDDAWTSIDSGAKNDCVSGTAAAAYSNIKDVNGKYGCNFGFLSNTATFGTFVPDHFTLISAQTRQRSDIAGAYATTRETTGTIVAGTAVLTVADMTDFSAGDTAVVFGAGSGGKDLLATITAAASNVLTLGAPAATSVTNAPVFKRLGFTYMDEPLQLALSLEARNATGGKTKNYTTTSPASTNLAKLDASSLTGTGSNSWNLSGVVNNLYGVASCRALFSGGSPYNTTYTGCASLPAGVLAVSPYAASAARVAPSNTSMVTWSSGATTLTTDITLKRASSPDGAFDFANGTFALGIWPRDGDGITFLNENDGASLLNAAKSLDIDASSGADLVAVGVADMRLGRLKLQNMYGSERLPLNIPIQAQYWNNGYFANNADDNNTALTAPTVPTPETLSTPNGQPNLFFYPVVATVPKSKNQLSSSDTTISLATSSLTSGTDRLTFTAPLAHPGWLDIILYVPDYLRYNWGNCDGQLDSLVVVTPNPLPLNDFPCARATFGTYKSPLIYRRENY